MPTLKLPDCELFYQVDDFTDPWRPSDTVLMLHGNAESSLAWYAWVPVLARHLRVVRPDMRGYGQSTPMPREYGWTLDQVIDDYCRLMDSLKIERFHLVAAKIGGTIARAFAARWPDRIKSLTVIGTPQALRPGAENIPALIEEFETKGAEHWARRTMAGRLGEHFPAAGVEWWTQYMGRAPVSSLIGFNRGINYADIRADLPKIKCPTLVITTEESGLGTVARTREWQEQIADSRLLVLPGKSYHVAASDAEACATATLGFIREARPPERNTSPMSNHAAAFERPQTFGEEVANAVSHGIALVASIVAIPILVINAARTGSTSAVVGASLFGATLFLLYLASMLYHVMPAGKAKRVFVIIDHCAIFLLIAGTYTPFTLGVLSGPWGWSLFGVVWGLALVGILLKTLLGTKYQNLSVALYLLMGWLVVVAVQPMLKAVPLPGLLWLLAGGLFYTFGVAFFHFDHRLRYAHFVWHVFVFAGSFCHFMAVLGYAT